MNVYELYRIQLEELQERVNMCYSVNDLDAVGVNTEDMDPEEIENILNSNVELDVICKLFNGYEFGCDDFFSTAGKYEEYPEDNNIVFAYNGHLAMLTLNNRGYNTIEFEQRYNVMIYYNCHWYKEGTADTIAEAKEIIDTCVYNPVLTIAIREAIKKELDYIAEEAGISDNLNFNGLELDTTALMKSIENMFN